MAKDLQGMMRELEAFRDERDWAQLHKLAHLAAISIEAAELQELFLWLSPAEQNHAVSDRKARIEEEFADDLITALNFAIATGIDPLDAVDRKIKANAERYPVDETRGSAVKYSDR